MKYFGNLANRYRVYQHKKTQEEDKRILAQLREMIAKARQKGASK